MTIFLEISKHFIGEELKVLRDNLKNRSKSACTSDEPEELTQKKLDLIDEVINRFKNLPDENSDELTLNATKKLVVNCRDIAKAKSDERECNPGPFHARMQDIENLLQVVFDEIKKLEQLDLHPNTDPLNVFRHHIALYFTKHAIQDYKTAPHGGSWADKLTPSRKLATQKKDKIRQILADCEQRLCIFDKECDKAKAAQRHATVLDFAEKIILENQKLCNNSRGIFFRPSPGFLAVCMQNAINQLAGNPLPELAAAAEIPDIAPRQQQQQQQQQQQPQYLDECLKPPPARKK